MTALVLGLPSTPWRTVLAAHRPAAVLAAVLGIELWVVAEVARLLELLPIVILLAAGAVAGATLIFMSWATRLAILGPDGAWVLEILLSRLPGRSRMAFGGFGATVREPDHRPGGDPGSSSRASSA
jgi:hypothetical protein